VRLRWRALLERGAELKRQKQNYASDGNDPSLIGTPVPASQPQLTHTHSTTLKKKKKKETEKKSHAASACNRPPRGQKKLGKSYRNRFALFRRHNTGNRCEKSIQHRGRRRRRRSWHVTQFDHLKRNLCEKLNNKSARELLRKSFRDESGKLTLVQSSKVKRLRRASDAI
jgi:hypothetical protein